jgi:excisionase family DNA binding protein
MSNTIEQRRALSIREAAQACGLSRATLYRLIEQRKLETVKVLGRRLVRLEALDVLLNGSVER